MSDVVYRSREYIILSKRKHDKTGFIVVNTKKEFNQGHTHVTNFNSAKTLIKLSQKCKIPNSKNKYFIQSLIRISRDKTYINRLNNM